MYKQDWPLKCWHFICRNWEKIHKCISYHFWKWNVADSQDSLELPPHLWLAKWDKPWIRTYVNLARSLLRPASPSPDSVPPRMHNNLGLCTSARTECINSLVLDWGVYSTSSIKIPQSCTMTRVCFENDIAIIQSMTTQCMKRLTSFKAPENTIQISPRNFSGTPFITRVTKPCVRYIHIPLK